MAKSYVYLDGGEIWVYPEVNSTEPVAVWNENTYAIPLNSSWTTNDVTPMVVGKKNTLMVTRQPDAFYDAEHETVYSLGGSAYHRGGSFLITNPRVDVQSFSTEKDDGKAGWAVASTAGLAPASMPAGNIKSTGPDAHWSIGGYTSYITSKGYEGRYTMNSMVEYNMTTRQFTNTTLDDSKHLYGQGEWVPFGKKGSIVMFGGQGPAATKADSRHIDGTFSDLSMQAITIYDVDSKKFYSQKTRGPAIPTGRSSFCTVGAGQTGNGTYEIIMYGGKSKDMLSISDDTFEDLKTVWILTLPAFTWVRSTLGPSQRSQNHCAKLNDNLMLSVGGWLEVNKEFEYGNGMGGLKDILPNGLGLFDLSQQEWVTGYTRNYPNIYTQPKIVSDVYAGINQSEWKWDDEAVKAIFVTEKPLVVEESAPKTDGSATEAPAATEVPAEEKKIPIGAIVGGVVGGGLGLAAIGALVFFCLRRKKAAAATNSKVEEEYATPELESTPYGHGKLYNKVPQTSVDEVPPTPPVEVQGSRGGHEMWTESHYHEAGSGQVHEISSVIAPGGGQVYEMVGEGR